MVTPSAQATTAPSKTKSLMRRARISSGGVRSRSHFFATGRDGCFGTRDVYYGVAAYATWGHLKVERVVLNALANACGLPPDIRAIGDPTVIVFGEADPPV